MSMKVLGTRLSLVLPLALTLGAPSGSNASKSATSTNSPTACAEIGGSCAAPHQSCSGGSIAHDEVFCDAGYTTLCCIASSTHSKASSSHLRAIQEGILLGTEFTFSRPDIAAIQMGKSSASKAHGPMQQWGECVLRRNKGAKLAITKVRGKSEYAHKFTYDLGKGSNWWWIVDADDSCLETQTKPITAAMLLSHPGIQRIINEDIFACAASLELIPDPSAAGGGGHISLDRDTTFGGDALLFIETLSLLEASSATWIASLGFDDPLNAPWVGQQTLKKGQPALTAYRKLLATLQSKVQDAKPMNLPAVVARLHTFTMKLRNPKLEEMKQSPSARVRDAAAQAQSAPLHYQAVNLEHMLKTDGTARMELRALGAQPDLDTLHRDLQFIFRILVQARQNLNEASHD